MTTKPETEPPIPTNALAPVSVATSSVPDFVRLKLPARATKPAAETSAVPEAASVTDPSIVSDESSVCQSTASGFTVASRCSTSKVIAGTPTSEPETSFTSTP